MLIMTENLTDAALDWAVATSEGYSGWDGECFTRYQDGYPGAFFIADYHPSTNWTHGGPIIERERIDVAHYVDGGHPDGGECGATVMHNRSIYEAFGPTPLIAAMRVYVMSRLGDEVDVPDELCA